MTIHHLNCGTLRPYYPKLQSIVYCLLVESSKGLILVDTGFGTRDYSQPSMMMNVFLTLLGVPRDNDETAVEQVKSLGYAPEDIRHIVLTHLHLDHAGGLPDFPDAKVHVYRGEYEAMIHHTGLLSWGCEKAHFRHDPHWVFHDSEQETWFGFESIKVFKDCAPEIRLIMLPGHTHGHCGVAVATENGWLLHCGDAASPFHKYTDVYERDPKMNPFPYMPKWFTRWIIGGHVDSLRVLQKKCEGQITFISGHDIYSYNQLSNIGE